MLSLSLLGLLLLLLARQGRLVPLLLGVGRALLGGGLGGGRPQPKLFAQPALCGGAPPAGGSATTINGRLCSAMCSSTESAPRLDDTEVFPRVPPSVLEATDLDEKSSRRKRPDPAMSSAISREVTEHVVQWVRQEVGTLLHEKLDVKLSELLSKMP